MAYTTPANQNSSHVAVADDYDTGGETDAESVEIGLKLDYYVKNEIEKNYPVVYIVIDSVLMGILNICLISLQIILMHNHAALAFIGAGVWAGIYNIFTLVLALLTIKYRNILLIKIVVAMKLFGTILSFGCFFILQIASIYHYDCLAGSYYNVCNNKEMQNLHYIMIVFGVPCLALSLGFFIYFQFKMMMLKRNYAYQNTVKYANNS